jgi:hypothetical protein
MVEEKATTKVKMKERRTGGMKMATLKREKTKKREWKEVRIGKTRQHERLRRVRGLRPGPLFVAQSARRLNCGWSEVTYLRKTEVGQSDKRTARFYR